jgi:hypothetical protein
MTPPPTLEIAELQRTWNSRREALRVILRRFDVRGMARPARDPAEQEWLRERGPAWFREDEACAEAARLYYRRRYGGS